MEARGVSKKKFEPAGVCKFVVKDTELVNHLWQVARRYQHIANMYILLRDSYYEASRNCKTDTNKRIFQLFTNRRVLRAVLKDRDGGEHKENVEELRRIIPACDLYSAFKSSVSIIQIKNFYKLQHKINTGFKSFFTKLAKGDKDAKPPKPKKLARVHRVTIPIDQDCLSLKRKGIVRINVEDKMIDIPISHKQLKAAVGDLSLIGSAEITCTCNEFEIGFIYNRPLVNEQDFQTLAINSQNETKNAGLDIGIKNLASIFIDDKTSRSMIVSGKDFIAFNAKNNRKIAKLSSEKQLLINQIKGIEKKSQNACKDALILEQLKKVTRKISKTYSHRNKFFYSNFNKLANRILEQLSILNVTDLYISRNLGEAKQDPKASMGKKNNQKFHQIPIISLLDMIQRKAADYGVKVHELDEAYTSKTSCLSGDIVAIQEFFMKPEEDKYEEDCKAQAANVPPKKTIEFGGTRKTRAYYKDKLLKKIYHADLNAAANHIKVGLKLSKDYFMFLKDHFWKLANPIKLNASKCFLDKLCFV